MGIPDRTPNFLASYEQDVTTPRPLPFFGSAPTINGLPFSEGYRGISFLKFEPCFQALWVCPYREENLAGKNRKESGSVNLNSFHIPLSLFAFDQHRGERSGHDLNQQ